jgi:hypothetical protein
MSNASTGDATVGAEQDGVGRRPDSFERQPRCEEGSVEKAMGRPGDLGTPTALRCEGTAGAAERDGSRGECESGEGEIGIGFFLRSRPQGDKAVHMEAVLHGLRVEAGKGRWHGAERQQARSELTAARLALQRPGAHTQGGNGRWVGCPGGLGSVL